MKKINKNHTKAFIITYIILKILFILAITLGIAWFVYSIGEVWVVGYTYDGTGPCEYSDINLFVHMLDWLS